MKFIKLKSRSYLAIPIFGVLFQSCILSTQQETQLNADMNQFIIVRNEGDALSYMDYTHPLIVKYYKEKGTIPFKEKFKEVPRKHERERDPFDIVFWNKGYIKSATSNDSLIQAKIQITLLKDNRELDSSSIYYGVSTKQGSKWIFISKSDYFTIFPKQLRLFKE